MSSKRALKAKEPRESEGAAAVPTANKRQKSSTDAHQSDRSLLLQAQPEILRKVYSFLSLKEALILRQTHRQFNEAANDLYQYSFIMNENVLKRQGIAGNDYFYTSKQTKTVCNLVDNENLRALLRNETLNPGFMYNFIQLAGQLFKDRQWPSGIHPA